MRGASHVGDTDARWADVVVAAMKEGGVDNLFFVSGSELAFYQEASARAKARGKPAPRLVTMTNEHTAMCAAIGNAMFRNAPAATAVHIDVGTLHQGAAVHAAWKSEAPVLMTAGTGPRAPADSMPGGRDHPIQWLQEPRDQAEIVRQFTKVDHRMEYMDHPGTTVSRLLQLSMTEPRGPVYLSLPRELAMLPSGDLPAYPTRDELGVGLLGDVPIELADEIATRLIAADFPTMILERSGRDPEAVGAVVELAELLALSVHEADTSDRLNIPHTHWALGGRYPLPECDAVLVLDGVIPFAPGIVEPQQEAFIAWIGRDPVVSRGKTMDHRADVRVTADPARAARAISAAVRRLMSRSDRDRVASRRTMLKKRAIERQRQLPAELARDVSQRVLTGRVVSEAIGRRISPNGVILNDAVTNGRSLLGYAPRTEPQTYFRSGSSAGGWGGGAAIGVKLAAPDRDVVHATGDGYYLFGNPLTTAWAAATHAAAYLTVVYVNGSYGTGTQGLRDLYPEGYAVTAGDYTGGVIDPCPRFGAVLESVGGFGADVDQFDQLASAMDEAFRQVRNGVPALVAVRVPGPLASR